MEVYLHCTESLDGQHLALLCYVDDIKYGESLWVDNLYYCFGLIITNPRPILV